MTRYYKVDGRKITFLEYWRLSRKKTTAIRAWLRKILGNPVSPSLGFTEATSWNEQVVDPNQLPQQVLRALEPAVQDCAEIGFRNPYYHCLRDRLGPGESGGVYLLHESGEVGGGVVFVRYGKLQSSVISFLSFLHDGQMLMTSNKRREFNSPLEPQIERLVGATAQELWKRHVQRIEKVRASNPPRKLSVPGAYQEWFDRITRVTFEHNVLRGLWVEMSADEVAALRQKFSQPRT
jgi:hypothetical protein